MGRDVVANLPVRRWLASAVVAGIGVFQVALAADQTSVSNPAADVAWADVKLDLIDTPTVDGMSYVDASAKWGERSPEFWRWYASARQQLRDRGIKFWDEFPSDSRKFKWLAATVNQYPFYWQDLEQGAQMSAESRPELAIVNESAVAAWNVRYVSMRAEYLTAAELTDGERQQLLISELQRRVIDALYANKRGENRDLTELVNEIWDASVRYPREELGEVTERLFEPLFFSDMLERDSRLEASVIASLKLNPRTNLRLFGIGREQVAHLRGTPMELKLRTLQGTEMDLAHLRGKVVLVEFWNLGCHACIESMPRVKAVYERYGKKGFEVVGVCMEDETKGDQVARLMKKMRIPWSQSLAGGLDGANPIAAQYAIVAVPVTFLLDKRGMLVTNDISYGLGDALENRIQQLLGPDN